MTVWICDWTHWQGMVLPAEGVARQGFGMVKLKASGASREGRYFEDPMFLLSAAQLLRVPSLIPAAFHYLMPGRGSAQAGLFYDLLSQMNVQRWAAFLDVEAEGLHWRDVDQFAQAWYRLTNNHPLHLYTRRNYWETLGAPLGLGRMTFPVLEEAHWVPAAVRNNPATQYANAYRQAKAIDPTWWDVNYGGWKQAAMLQFTDGALVQGRRTSASMFRGTLLQLRTLLGVT